MAAMNVLNVRRNSFLLEILRKRLSSKWSRRIPGASRSGKRLSSKPTNTSYQVNEFSP